MKKYFTLLAIILVTAGLTHTADQFFSAPRQNFTETDSVVWQQFSEHVRSFAPESSVVHKQFNFHLVSPGVWRSSQPNEEALVRMKKYGLKTIVNLRGEGSVHQWESALAEKLGINYYNFPMDARQKQDPERLKEILGRLHDPANQPALIHCHAGKDRTGLVAALYKLQFTDARFEDVHKEMLMFGYHEGAFPAVIETIREWDTGRP